MSHLRWDPTLREWVVYAPQRQDRTFLPPAEWCPLCPTREGAFPTEIPADRYEIVVFENRFPSLSTARAASGSPPEDCYRFDEASLAPSRPGDGACEVVLYTDNHSATLADMSEKRIGQLIEVWTDRYSELGARPEVAYVFIFENKGESIGVTLSHPHGQIYAYPFIPPRPAREILAAREFAAHEGECLHCTVLAQERRDGRRILVEGEAFSAFVPAYAHYPYEAHIYAHRCVGSVSDLRRHERTDLARVIKHVLMGYDALWTFSMPYIMAMHQAPTDGADYTGVAHMHLEFYPPHRTPEKLKYLAGSEAGAGAFVVDALPEDTAAALRQAIERAVMSS